MQRTLAHQLSTGCLLCWKEGPIERPMSLWDLRPKSSAIQKVIYGSFISRGKAPFSTHFSEGCLEGYCPLWELLVTGGCEN